MRAPSRLGLIGLVLFSASAASAASDCASWARKGPDAKSAEIAATIEGHLGSHVSRRYTSESRVAIQRCLREFSSQIVEQYDQVCGERPGASSTVLDDVFDRYLLSCVR